MNRNTRKDLQARCQALHRRMGEELREQIEDEGMRSDYAFTLLLRLVFAYFLQQKGLLDGDASYLQSRLERCGRADQSFSLFLACLTYWGFGTPTAERTGFAWQLLGKVPYLSGSLFYPHPSERLRSGQTTWAVPELSNQVFEEALAAFQWYTWTLVEGKDFGGPEGVVTPAFLGTMAEHHVEHRKQTGSFYTPADICTYIVRQTCEPLILQQYEQMTGCHCDSVEQLIESLDDRDCALLLFVILPTLSILESGMWRWRFPGCRPGQDRRHLPAGNRTRRGPAPPLTQRLDRGLRPGSSLSRVRAQEARGLPEPLRRRYSAGAAGRGEAAPGPEPAEVRRAVQ